MVITERRALGGSGISIAPVAFGTWAIGGWYWGGTDDDVAVAAIHRAIDLGINCIDTAPVYGFGHSEQVVGRAIAERRGEVVIATKCGLRWDTGRGEPFFETQDARGRSYQVVRNLRRDSILAECDASLKRLGVEEIDVYQCHWPDATTGLDDAAEAMDRLLERGKIRAIGLSNHSVEAMTRFASWLPLACVQPPYSLLERGIEESLLPWCRTNGVGVLAYGPLQQGLLTGRVTPDRSFPPGDERPHRPEFAREHVERVLAAIERAGREVDTGGASPAQLAIRWVADAPGITAALVGARRVAQVEENARALVPSLPAGYRLALSSIFDWSLDEVREKSSTE